MENYFEIHLREAIALNRQRRAYYIARTAGKARLLSHWLVASEQVCLPVARYFDKRAKLYIQQGVPVVKNDFVDMADVADVEQKTRYRGIASHSTRTEVRNLLRRAKREGRSLLGRADYAAICVLLADALHQLEEIEAACRAHFAMSQHVLESTGLAALHAPQYIASDASVGKLCRQLVGIQLYLLEGSVLMDSLAQPCHALGAGIIVNDVPAIPFLQEYADGSVTGMRTPVSPDTRCTPVSE